MKEASGCICASDASFLDIGEVAMKIHRFFIEKKVKIFFLTFMVILFATFFFSGIYSFGKDSISDKQVVRVAWYNIPGFQDYDPQGNPCGYAFEYLEKLAEYRNWKLTYVPASYDEALELVSLGQIDFMFSNPRSEHDARFLYSDKGPAAFGLRFVTLRSNQKNAFQDYPGYEGMRVGIVRNQEIKLETLSYMQGKGVHITLIEYESETELMTALKDQKIDGIVLTPLRDEMDFRMLDEFSFRTLQLITSSQSSQLMEEINRAMDNLERYQVGFVNRLYQQYYGIEHEGNLILSRQESLYVKQNPVVDVYIGPDWYPIIYKNENKNGERDGILFDFLEYLTDQTGLRFRIINYDNYAQIYDTQGYRMNQSISLTNMSYMEAKNYKLQLTDNFLNTTFYKVSSNVDRRSSSKEKIALPIGVYYQPELLKGWSQYEFIYYHSMEECLDAIVKGDATTTFMNAYEQSFYLQKNKYKNLVTNILPAYESAFCFSVSWSSNTEIKSILEKGLLSIPKGEWNRIVEDNTNYQGNTTMSFVLEKNVGWIIAFCFILLILTLCLLFYFLQLKKQERLNKQNLSELENQSKIIQKNLWEMNFVSQIIHDWTAELEEKKEVSESNRFIQEIRMINNQTNQLLIEMGKPLPLESEMTLVYEQSVFSYLLLLIRQEASKKNIQVLSTFQIQNHYPIYMNQRKIIQALLHLLQNAIKFSNRNSMVEFSVHSSSNNQDNSVRHIYEIIDHGMGMSPSKMEELFINENVKSSDGGREQYVYRLAETKKDIEDSGGQILCESVLGKGTIFTIIMDYLKGEDEVHVSNKSSDANSNENIRVLLGFGQSLERLQIGEKLEQNGILVDYAENGQRVIEKYLQAQSGYYQIIILNDDLSLMNSIEVSTEIRKMRRSDSKSILLFGVGDKYGSTVSEAENAFTYRMDKAALVEKIMDVIQIICEGRKQ